MAYLSHIEKYIRPNKDFIQKFKKIRYWYGTEVHPDVKYGVYNSVNRVCVVNVSSLQFDVFCDSNNEISNNSMACPIGTYSGFRTLAGWYNFYGNQKWYLRGFYNQANKGLEYISHLANSGIVFGNEGNSKQTEVSPDTGRAAPEFEGVRLVKDYPCPELDDGKRFAITTITSNKDVNNLGCIFDCSTTSAGQFKVWHDSGSEYSFMAACRSTTGTRRQDVTMVDENVLANNLVQLQSILVDEDNTIHGYLSGVKQTESKRYTDWSRNNDYFSLGYEGATSATNFFKGHFSALIIQAGNIEEADITDLVSYLETNHGVPIRTPITMPNLSFDFAYGGVKLPDGISSYPITAINPISALEENIPFDAKGIFDKDTIEAFAQGGNLRLEGIVDQLGNYPILKSQINQGHRLTDASGFALDVLHNDVQRTGVRSTSNVDVSGLDVGQDFVAGLLYSPLSQGNSDRTNVVIRNIDISTEMFAISTQSSNTTQFRLHIKAGVGSIDDFYVNLDGTNLSQLITIVVTRIGGILKVYINSVEKTSGALNFWSMRFLDYELAIGVNFNNSYGKLDYFRMFVWKQGADLSSYNWKNVASQLLTLRG